MCCNKPILYIYMRKQYSCNVMRFTFCQGFCLSNFCPPGSFSFIFFSLFLSFSFFLVYHTHTRTHARTHAHTNTHTHTECCLPYLQPDELVSFCYITPRPQGGLYIRVKHNSPNHKSKSDSLLGSHTSRRKSDSLLGSHTSRYAGRR